MSASNEVRFKIGADTSALQRGFTTAQTMAAQAGNLIEKRFSSKHLFKSIFGAVGVDIESISRGIARAVTGMTEDVEKAYSRIIEAGNRATASVRSIVASRQTPAEQIKTLESEGRREARAGGMKEEHYTQRILRQLPVVGPFFENKLREQSIYSTEERMASVAEEQAAAQERAEKIEALRLQNKDLIRKADDVQNATGMAFHRSIGEPNAHDAAQLRDLKRQRDSVISEANDPETSHARSQQLLIQGNEILIKQYELEAKTRKAELDTTEKIQQINRDAVAVGETKGEHIARMRREAADAARKSQDATRSEDDRRGFRVQAAERTAAASRAEFDLKIGAPNMAGALKTPGGRRNTTTQGILARRATDYRERAEAARARGSYAEAARLGGLATAAEEKFNINDRRGMVLATGGAGGVVGASGQWIPSRAASAAARLVSGDVKPKELAQLSPESKQLVGIKKTLDEINSSLKPTETE